MEIGYKIKSARKEAGMMQEQAAEALGVSRQTVSNWENNRSYPDIISVIKMSDLYSVSLDHLLKEQKEAAEMKNSYYDYLEESTNVVKSNNRRGKISEIGGYLIVWTISVLCFYTMTPGDELGYVISSTYLVLPVVTLIVSAIIGHDPGWTRIKWLMPLFFGGMFAVSSLVTFGIASGSIFNYLGEYAAMLAIGAVISAVGVALGSWLKKLTAKGFKRAMVILTILLLILPILIMILYASYENYQIVSSR